MEPDANWLFIVLVTSEQSRCRLLQGQSFVRVFGEERI